jgi:hypothetical protein
MSDIIINNPFPAVQYEPTESSGIYHEDREVALSVGVGSQMYRTYNAQFDPSSLTWKLQTSGVPAFATVQNADGSIHYYTKPGTSGPWTSWAGSGNNAVYNAVDYGLVAGTGVSQSQQTANVAALQAAVNAALGAGGGTVVVPAGTYELSGTVTIDNVNGGLIVKGESTGTTLVQQGTPQSENVNSCPGMSDGTEAADSLRRTAALRR